jgi:Flp pilus assembly protein TadG
MNAHPVVDKPRRRGKGDDGAILIFLGLSVTMLLVVAALVLDGGSAYVQRRQGQNAADAAAMAGTRALDRYRFPPSGTTPDVTTISSQVTSVATANGATAVTSCRLINFDQIGTANDLGACTSVSAANNAEGVRVTLSNTRTTYFGGVTGKDTTTATTTAAATIQELTGLSAPFVICGNPAADSSAPALLNADGTINASNAAAAGTFQIHGPQIPKCGIGSNFKGPMDNPSIALGQWNDVGSNGVKAGHYSGTSTSGNLADCPPDGPFDQCYLILPVMDQGQGNGSNPQAHITAFALFYITAPKSNEHWASFVSVGVVGSGQGAGVDLGSNPGTSLIIKLVE